MSHPEWLKQVTEIPVSAVSASPDKSETGAVLSAIADAMDETVPQFTAGTVVGAVIDRLATAQYALIVASGDTAADIQRVAEQYNVELVSIKLVPAAELVTSEFAGLVGCLRLATEPQGTSAPNRVTLDSLNYQLQRWAADGVPGSTVVATAKRTGYANFEVQPRLVSVAKAEYEKRGLEAKYVYRSGIHVLVLG